MLKKLTEKLEQMARSVNTFDPGTLGDPIAEATEWRPLKGGGANFRTHSLVKVSFNRLEFRASLGAKLFGLIFMGVGMGVMVLFGLNANEWVPVLFGLIFALVGGGILYSSLTPIVFDQSAGYFWKGRKAPRLMVNKADLKNATELDQIHALQLISERCHGSKRSYTSHELNLVLKDGRRLNVVDHGNLEKLREDAGTLAAFLKKPVWDAAGFWR